MKKLMIVAAAAAMVGGTQAAELCYEDLAGDSCAVYNVKFTFKTLAAKRDSNCGLTWLIDDQGDGMWTRTDIADVTISDATTAAGGAHDQTVFPRVRAYKRALYWADNATRTFDGILWQCTASCFESLDLAAAARFNGWANGHLNYALWEKRSQTSIAYPVIRYYTKKDRSRYGWWTLDARRSFDFLGRYGQTAQKVAAYWTPWIMRGNIEAAGFGTYDSKGKRMKAVSGNAVGMIAPLNAGAADACGRASRFFVQIAFMCEDFIQWCCDGCYAGVELVPASGTWSIKYNASLSKGNKSLSTILPNYTVFGSAIFGSAGWTRVRNYLNANLYNVTVDDNGIFYAPWKMSYLVDDEGAEIGENGEYTVEDYLDHLALCAGKATALEIFADLDASNEYVEDRIEFNSYSKDAGKVTYVVGDTEVAPDGSKYDWTAAADSAELIDELRDFFGILDEKEENYPDGTKEGEE